MSSKKATKQPTKKPVKKPAPKPAAKKPTPAPAAKPAATPDWARRLDVRITGLSGKVTAVDRALAELNATLAPLKKAIVGASAKPDGQLVVEQPAVPSGPGTFTPAAAAAPPEQPEPSRNGEGQTTDEPAADQGQAEQGQPTETPAAETSAGADGGQ